MNLDQPSHVKKRGLWKWLKLIAFSLLGGYLLLFFVMNSSWFKGKVTTALERKSGLEWNIGGVSWVPFSSVNLSQIESAMGDGGIKIDSLKLVPQWGKIFSKQLEWDELIVDKVDIVVDQRWLKERFKNQKLVQLQQKSAPKQKLPTKQNKQQPTKRKVASGKKIPKVKPVNRPVPQEQVIPVTSEKWLRVKRMNVKFLLGDSSEHTLNNISVDLPVGGEQAEGDIAAEYLGEDFHIPVYWDGRQLLIKGHEFEVADLGVKLIAQLLPNKVAPLFKFDLLISDQKFSFEESRPNFKASVSADSVSGQYSMRGNLLRPRTWQGLGLVRFTDVGIKETLKTQKQFNFDQMYAKWLIHGGNLILDDARAISDDLSFMANGVILSNAESYGVMRCVTDDRYGEWIEFMNRFVGIFRLQARKQLFEDLDNPDRSYFDIHLEGRAKNINLVHKHSSLPTKLSVFFDRLVQFKNSELKEDGIYQELGAD